MKPGVITDGISRNPERAFAVMNEFGLEYAELQYIDELEAGDLNDAQTARLQDLLAAHKLQVPCISRHIFGGLALGELELDSPVYRQQLAALRRCIEFAQALDCPLVRVMSFRKEMILFGGMGADQWIVTAGAWDKLLQLMAPALEIAEAMGTTLVVETGNNAMITSAWLGARADRNAGHDPVAGAVGPRQQPLLQRARLARWLSGSAVAGREPAGPSAHQGPGGQYPAGAGGFRALRSRRHGDRGCQPLPRRCAEIVTKAWSRWRASSVRRAGPSRTASARRWDALWSGTGRGQAF